jgi:hypothetical protein
MSDENKNELSVDENEISDPNVNTDTGASDQTALQNLALIVGTKLRAVNPEDNVLADIDVYNIRVAELTESLLKTPEAVAISRLAYHQNIEQIVRQNQALQNMLLIVAEDLAVVMSYTNYNVQTGEVVQSSIPINHAGNYKNEQLTLIAWLARKKITALHNAISHTATVEKDQQTEIGILNSTINDLQKEITRLKDVPALPDAQPNPVILYYRDKKGRFNYLGRSGETFIRTRDLRQAIRCPSIPAAALILLEVLRDVLSHAFPQAYRLEIGTLQINPQTLTLLDKKLTNDLTTARQAAFGYAKENKTKTSRRQKNKRQNKATG